MVEQDMMDIQPGAVAVAYVHLNRVTAGFGTSLARACLWRKNRIGGIVSASSPRQYLARNSAIDAFLQGPAEWLMWIDTDMTFEHDAIEKLLKTARKTGADMVAGLCFILERQNNVVKFNAFNWSGEDKEFQALEDYKDGEVLDVDGTGSAFVLINRKVLETTGPNWHKDWTDHPAGDGPMGHDLAFFYEACIVQGYRLVYDTAVEAGHIKHFELNEDSFRAYKEMQT